MFEIGVADCASNDRLNSCRGLFFVGVFFFAMPLSMVVNK